MRSDNERMQYQKQNKPKRHKPKQSAPRWMVLVIAFLSLVVILLGIGITTMVVMLEQQRIPTAQSEEQVLDQEDTSAESNNPVVIKLITATPIPTNTPPQPTPTLVVESTDTPIVVDRDQRPELRPNLAPSPIITAADLPAGTVTASHIKTPFVIDGDLTGWADIPPFVSAYTVFQQPWWDQSDDLDAFWRLAWDDEHLYIGVVIVDDVHVQTQQVQTAYRGDSLEIQIDTNYASDPDSLINEDDFQLILSPGDFNQIRPNAFRFQGNTSQRMEGVPGHEINVSAVKTDTGYVLEAAIPWADIDLRPLGDLVLGITLSANDNDLAGVAVQEMMKSHIATRTFNDPATWGVLILSGTEESN